MGFYEKNIVDWTHKTMEYQGKKLYILETFLYKGVKYLYAIDKDTINDEMPTVTFLYNEKGNDKDVFTYVDDDDLFDNLMLKVTLKNVRDLVAEGLNEADPV